MKIFLLILFFTFGSIPLFAKHITGGEVTYNYTGTGAGGSKKYSITLRLFRDNFCTGCAQMPANVTLGIFNNDDNTKIVVNQVIPLASTEPLSIVASPPCISNSPLFDYSVGYYTFVLDLPDNINGYSIAYQTCCRVDGITNIGLAPSVGATYLGSIPGQETLGSETDNGARFEKGISIICQGKPFILNFSATDPDGDQLRYSFVSAYNGGDATDASFNNPDPPPYGSVPYSVGFSATSPLGSLATINVNTGIISGISPASGQYIVCVMVQSFRNGIFIASHRKDFIVTVAPCDFASSELKVTYTNCENRDFTFKNENSSLLNLTFDWNFGDPGSGLNNTSTQEFPQHTYSAPGDYTLTLIVNRNTPCADTATALVRVWPGFFPAFAPIGPQCKNTPVQFTDLTTTSFPPVTFWRWDFGVQTLTNDTSRLQNPTYTYNTAGTYNASFIVETSKGCRDTLYPIVTIVDKPDFFISKDTLICTVDTLQLRSNVTTGTITWSPASAIIGSVNSYNPLVSPDVTTTYSATYQDLFGCVATIPVTVNVVSDVTLLAINDTTICRTDTVRLSLNTDALYFAWTPTNLIVDPTVKNPLVFPTNPIDTFHVKASISNKCFKEKDIIVKTAPYPIANITGDNQICFGKNAQLNATGGSIYLWKPANFLNNTRIPNPISILPKQTITYTVQVNDTLGCPKPAFKDFKVTVIKVIADAGPSDTSIVLDQPLQLNASGSTNYLWIAPTTWLSNINVKDPIANPLNNITYTVQVSNDIGCSATDTINVKVFFLPPDIYVPSAFTPSGDGKNDNFKPIPIGIKSLENFSVYSRWGELLFTTSKIGSGWDGTYKGTKQDPGTYVWKANATDYKNKTITRKGTVILIR